MEICFADFAKVLQQALQPPNDDKAVVNHLLGWITDRKTVLDKKGNPMLLFTRPKEGHKSSFGLVNSNNVAVQQSAVSSCTCHQQGQGKNRCSVYS